MTTKNKLINYYVISYNSNGRVNIINSNLVNLNKIYSVTCSSNSLLTFFLNKILDNYMMKDYSIEIIRNIFNKNHIDGVIINELKIGFINNNLLDNIFCSTSFINLDKDLPNTIKKNISELKISFENKLNEVVEYLKLAKKIHDQWETLYLNKFNFDNANTLANKILNDVFNSYEVNTSNTVANTSFTTSRFFGCISPDGAYNYVAEIIENIKYRYFIKGRPGTGKSTILKKIVKKAENLNLDVIKYYCASDSESLDMVLINEIDTVIFDSTSPHEFFPDKENDITIDTYKECVESNFDELHKEELNMMHKSYSSPVNNAILILKECRSILENIDKEYSLHINSDTNSDIIENIINNIVD